MSEERDKFKVYRPFADRWLKGQVGEVSDQDIDSLAYLLAGCWADGDNRAVELEQRITELEAQLVTIGRKMLKDETNRAIIRAAEEQPNQETIDALTEDSSQMNTYETVDEMMNDLELTTPTEVKRYVPIMQWDRETWKAVPAMRELTKHQTVFPCYRKDTDYDAEHTARVEAEIRRKTTYKVSANLREKLAVAERLYEELRQHNCTLEDRVEEAERKRDELRAEVQRVLASHVEVVTEMTSRIRKSRELLEALTKRVVHISHQCHEYTATYDVLDDPIERHLSGEGE